MRSELEDYVTLSIANGYSLATTGKQADGGPKIVLELGPVSSWKPNYLERYHGTMSGNLKVVGACYIIEYHTDLLAYGGLDPTHNIASGVLHNTLHGIGSQINNFYSQWVHFRWHDTTLPFGVSPNAYSVYNTGNSLHPTSPYFHNNYLMWERDGEFFDLEETQANPTIYLRESPLID